MYAGSVRSVADRVPDKAWRIPDAILTRHYKAFAGNFFKAIAMLLYFSLGLAKFGIYCSSVCKLVFSCGWKFFLVLLFIEVASSLSFLETVTL